MCNFIMLIGLPGSGKSTYAKKLEKEGYRIHSSDAIREELTGDANSQEKNAEVFEILHDRVRKDLKFGQSCVYDATNLTSKRRRAFLKTLNKIVCVKQCILFLIPPEECKKRNMNRDRKVPDKVIDNMLKTFWVPMYYEGWDDISIIGDYKYTIPFNQMEGFDQKNKNHKFTLLAHMRQAALYIENNWGAKLPTKKIMQLKNAAGYHDIGKFFTQTFVNSKGEKTKDAHYYGHENYGSYLFLLDANYRFSFFNFDLESIFYIAALINWHMKPYTAWKQSKKAMKKDLDLIGREMYEDIMKLHEADHAAHTY